MKLECFKDKLRWSLGLAEKISAKNLSLSSLGYVLLESGSNALTIKATNLEIGVEIKIPAKVERSGRVALNGSLALNLLSNLARDEKIKLETANQNLVVSTKQNSSLIKTYPAEDFPDFRKETPADFLSFLSVSLVEGLRSVWYAAANSDAKPEISSVYFYVEGGDLVFVATDTFRLAEKRLTLEKNQPAKATTINLLLPTKSVAEIIRIFEGLDEEIKIAFDEHQIFILTPEIYFSSRLVGGTFPDYKQIIPSKAETEVVVAMGDFLGALRLANVFSGRLNQISFKISASEKSFEVGSRGEAGETDTNLEAVLEGKDLTINFNVKYFLDCLTVLTGESLNLKFSGANRPLLITAVGDNSFRYLVMPLNR